MVALMRPHSRLSLMGCPCASSRTYILSHSTAQVERSNVASILFAHLNLDMHRYQSEASSSHCASTPDTSPGRCALDNQDESVLRHERVESNASPYQNLDTTEADVLTDEVTCGAQELGQTPLHKPNPVGIHLPRTEVQPGPPIFQSNLRRLIRSPSRLEHTYQVNSKPIDSSSCATKAGARATENVLEAI